MPSPKIDTAPKIDSAARYHVSSDVNVGRRASPGAGQRFAKVLAGASSRAIAAIDQAAGFSPIGHAVTAAITQGAGLANFSQNAGVGIHTSGLSSTADIGATQVGLTRVDAAKALPGNGDIAGNVSLDQQSQQTAALLQLQQQIGAEQRAFTTMSNVMKSKHDTAKSVINNMA